MGSACYYFLGGILSPAPPASCCSVHNDRHPLNSLCFTAHVSYLGGSPLVSGSFLTRVGGCPVSPWLQCPPGLSGAPTWMCVAFSTHLIHCTVKFKAQLISQVFFFLQRNRASDDDFSPLSHQTSGSHT